MAHNRDVVPFDIIHRLLALVLPQLPVLIHKVPLPDKVSLVGGVTEHPRNARPVKGFSVMVRPSLTVKPVRDLGRCVSVCSHQIERCLLLGRKVMTKLDSILKNRDITLLTKVHLVKALVFPIVMLWM